MAGRGWRSRPEFQYSMENPNPRMQPALNTLIDKICHMSFLQDHPERVTHLLTEIADWYFRRNKHEPEALWQTISVLMYKFHHMTTFAWQDKGRWVQIRHPGSADQLQIGSMAHVMLEDAFARRSPEGNIIERSAVFGDVTPTLQVPTEPVVEVSVVPTAEPRFDLNEFLAKNKGGVEHVIGKHMYNSHQMACTCGKEMDSWEAWTRHLRIKMYTYLKNEFPAFGGNDGEAPVEATVS